MRIFLAIPFSPHPGFSSNLWKANLHDSLVAMGHDVVLWKEDLLPLYDLDPDAPGTVPVRDAFGGRFVAAVENAHRQRPLDLVLTYFSDSHVLPSVVDTVRERVPVLNFFCNNVHQFHLVRRIAPRFSFCLVPEREALASYRAAGARPVFFPMAANPAVYRPLGLPQTLDVAFAGQRYADRARGLLALREGGIDAHAFGMGWPFARPGEPTPPGVQGSGLGPIGEAARLLAAALRGRNPFLAVRDRLAWRTLCARHPASLHGPVADDEYVALFSRSRISLGFLLVGDTHRTRRPLRQVRLREFEGPMAGAFYVTEWFEELAEHYEIGREIVCYRSHEELVDLCRYYLAHPDERERIRRSGHERARRDHTWQRRFENLFESLRREGVPSRP
ncbi:MAG TPA: glycosyltransferase [Candidatus Limnocylindria bacterium]|nr:glycosyltransferase [Candidatus Limnocylindria bacterium]